MGAKAKDGTVFIMVIQKQKIVSDAENLLERNGVPIVHSFHSILLVYGSITFNNSL